MLCNQPSTGLRYVSRMLGQSQAWFVVILFMKFPKGDSILFSAPTGAIWARHMV
jgi:hypothetical protein